MQLNKVIGQVRFFVCGGNDVENCKGPNVSTIKADYKCLMGYVKTVFPHASINMVSLIPRRTRHASHYKNMFTVNEWLGSMCTEYNVRFVDIFSYFIDRKSRDLNYKLFQRDQLHLTAVGDSVLAKVLIAVANKPRI